MEPNQTAGPAEPSASPEDPLGHQPGQVIGPSQEAPPTSPLSPVPPQPSQPIVTAADLEDPTGTDTQRPLGVASPAPPGMMVNGQVINQSSTPAFGSGKRLRLGKKAVIAAAAVTVLLGGSAAAYLGYYLPNKPENVLAKSLENSLSQHQLTTQGTANLTSSGLSTKVEYTMAVNEDQHTADIKLNTTVSGVVFPVELISAKGNLYFKIGDLSSLKGVINTLLGSDPSLKQLESQIIKTVTNQWIEIDSTLIKEAKLDCLASLPGSFSQSDIQAFQNSYKKNSFATIDSHSDDNVNGQSAVKYQLGINDDKLSGFDLSGSPFIKNINNCLKQAGGSALDLSSSKDGDTTPLTLWADKSRKLIVKYSTHSTQRDKAKDVQGDLTGTISYGPVNISAPSNSKPLLSLLNELNLGGLLGGFGSSDSTTTNPAKDTERKTDIRALQTQLEAHYVNSGQYPTLAQFNDSAWRAVNIKGYDPNALKDPDGSSSVLAASPTKNAYSYQPLPAGCDNIKTACQDYTLTATLSTGGTYVKYSLNSSRSLPSNVN